MKFNTSAYTELLKRRKANGEVINHEQKDHFLLKKVIKDTITGEQHTINKVLKEWFGGFYIDVVMSNFKTISYLNISCTDSEKISEIKENNIRYKLND